MIWLAAHMWFLLLVTFSIGLGVGWWIWGASAQTDAPPPGEAPMGSLEMGSLENDGLPLDDKRQPGA